MKPIPLAIFAALADEFRIIRSKMEVDERVTVRTACVVRGQYLKQPIMLVRTGVGAAAMARAVAYVCAQYRPELCLNVGYCGGAVPELVAGDLIIADRVHDAEGGASLDIDAALVQRAARCAETGTLNHRVGGIVTSAQVVSDPHEKAYLGTQYTAIGIDMESYAFVRACNDHGAACAVIRAVIDPMDMKLPDMGDAVDDEGEINVMGAFTHLMRKPKDLLAIPKIESCAIQAREATAKLIAQWLAPTE